MRANLFTFFYNKKMKTTIIDIQGMSCASCVARVEKKLHAIPGVEKAIVNLGLETATVDFNDSLTNDDALLKSIEDAGYEAQIKKKS